MLEKVKMVNPTIVVIAFNRPQSLSRLLTSLDRAYYKSFNVRLVISVDYSGSNDVINIAENFKWRFGEKEIIKRTIRLGLKNHILTCGDLVNLFDSIIMLEDDLYVSPYFYDYSIKSLEYFGNDENIAGISLYRHHFNETARFPFIPIEDGSDIFFLQIASSWGQIFWKEKWNQFRKWLNSNIDIDKIQEMPLDVRNWSIHSWKKYFIAYLILTSKYFVYPRISLTTNFSDAGQNIKKSHELEQVPILLGEKSDWNFIKLNESLSVYDAHCEIKSYILKKLNPSIEKYDFLVDLYGTKNTNLQNNKYILTSKKIKNSIYTFGLKLKPFELNLILEIKGDFFRLVENKRYYSNLFDKIISTIALFNYFYRETSIRMYFLLLLSKIIKILKKFT